MRSNQLCKFVQENEWIQFTRLSQKCLLDSSCLKYGIADTSRVKMTNS